MLRREEFCRHLWENTIDPAGHGASVEQIADSLCASPDEAFHSAGLAMKRMLDLGVAASDLGLAMRFASYEAVFATLYALEDPGVKSRERSALHEDLLMADPSGQEGRA
jgi:hypothetical protein